MPRKKVNRDRLNDKSHYRLQVNASQMLVACIVGPMEDFYKTSGIRNVFADVIEAAIARVFRQRWDTDPEFRSYFRLWADQWIDPPLRPEFDAYVAKLLL